MQKRPVRVLWWVLCALWLMLIFGHSMMPASLSHAESSGLLSRLTAALPVLTHRLLRKLAHFTEFAVLGFLLAQCLPAKPQYSLFAGLFCALCDETIQLFVLGRSGQVRDIWIDFAGVACAVAVTELLWLLVRRLRARRKLPAEGQEPQ